MPPDTAEEMPTPPPLDGELRFDEMTRNERARVADDVAKRILWTAPRSGRFAPQGQRHSTFGRSQVPGGIVADISALWPIGAVEGDRGGRRGRRDVERRTPRDVGAGQDAARAHRLP